MLIHFRINRNNGKVIQRHIAKSITGFGVYKESFNPFIVFACLIVSFINFERFREINKNQNEIEQFLFDNSVPVFYSILDNDHETSLLMYLYEDYVHVLIFECCSFYKYSYPEDCNNSFKIVENNKSLPVRDCSIENSFIT